MDKNLGFLITAIVLLFTVPQFSEAATETVRIYPTDDAVAHLYDEDRLSDWNIARNFKGEIYREPLTNSGSNEVAVRSDKGVGTYRIYRISKVFDLTSIPENAEVSLVTLNLYKTIGNNQGNIDVVVTSHERADVSMMQKQDWLIDTFGISEFARTQLLDNRSTGFNFNEDGVNFIKNKLGGQATVGLLTEFDFDDIEPAGHNILSAGWYEAESSGTEFDPYLEITYTVPDSGADFPLYTQIKSLYPSEIATASWASATYAEGKGNVGKYKCGLTIRQCGCAITSLVMSARSRGITVGADGTDINPMNINSWLEKNNGYSQTGSVVWSAAAKYFGTENEGVYTSRYQGITFGNSDAMGEIDVALATTSEDALGYKNGHYVFLSDKTADSYVVRDPVWYQTVTANDVENEDNKSTVNDYDNEFEEARILRVDEVASKIIGDIEVIIVSPVELRITQSDGLRAGYLSENNTNVREIELSGYDRDIYINLEGRIDVPDTTQKHLIVNKAFGKNKLELIGTATGDYSLYVYITGADGKTYIKEQTGFIRRGEILVFEINVDTGNIVQVDNEDENHRNDKHHKFFTRWVEKIENEVKKGKFHQVKAHIKTFHKLLKAKKVKGEQWHNKLEEMVGDHDHYENDRKKNNKKR